MLHLKSVYFIRSGKPLLNNIEWRVRRGENWVLFGKNGSGKTLLLSMIVGYLHPSRGDIYRFGNSPYGHDLREIRKKIGYIGIPLKGMVDNFLSISILDVVLSGYFATIGLYEPVTKEMKDNALELIDRIGMSNRINEPFRYLSDGEKQKILILRAVIGKPKILVFDEPAVGLDLPSREELLSLIEDLAKGSVANDGKKMSIIYTTHNTEEIIGIFKRILILDSGRIFFKGNIEDGLTSENLSELFKKNVRIFTFNNRYFTLIGGEDARK